MHPFLQFPQLFFLAPEFVPVLFRITIALSILYIVSVQYKRRVTLEEMRIPLIGKVGGLLWLLLAIELVLAAMFLFGYYTQFAALVGLVLSAKHYMFAKRYPAAIPLPRAAYVYIFVICIALVFMGAGAFAMDVPL